MHTPIQLLKRLPIKHKIWAAVGLLVAVIVAMAGISRLSVSEVQGGLHQVVNEAQRRPGRHPGRARLLPAHLRGGPQGRLPRGAGAVAELQAMPALRADPQARRLLEAIAEGVARFKGYKPRMLALADDPPENFPGRRFAAQNLNPISQELLQLVGNMIMAELDEEASEAPPTSPSASPPPSRRWSSTTVRCRRCSGACARPTARC